MKMEQDKKPGSGKIWQNKLTKPEAPHLTSKSNRKKHRKADYLVQNAPRRQIDLRKSSQKGNEKTTQQKKAASPLKNG